MTINLTDVAFDLLVAEQLHDIVPCGYCKKAAHWYVQCQSCAHVCLRCSLHRDADEERRQRVDWIKCRECEERYPPLPAEWNWVAL